MKRTDSLQLHHFLAFLSLQTQMARSVSKQWLDNSHTEAHSCGIYLAQRLPGALIEIEIWATFISVRLDERFHIGNASEPHVMFFVIKPTPVNPEAQMKTRHKWEAKEPYLAHTYKLQCFYPIENSILFALSVGLNLPLGNRERQWATLTTYNSSAAYSWASSFGMLHDKENKLAVN